MATKWQGEPKQWRVRGKSADGLAVTLGRHDTQKAAEAEAEKMRKEGFYRNVTVERIEQVDNPQVPDGKAPAGG